MAENKPRKGVAPPSNGTSKGTTHPHSSAASLRMKVFNPGSEAVFPVTSTIVYGPHEAMLVDAQFQKRYATELVQLIKSTNRTLKYIYISHSDPDYYFGLAEVAQAFPEARIISTPQTAYLISATKDAKLNVWKEALGGDAPSTFQIPEGIPSKELTIDGERIEIRCGYNDPAHSYLWIPSLRAIIGGISVLSGGHLWMADTTGADGIDAWLRVIKDMKGLAPARVIAGHYLNADETFGQLDFVDEYLCAYKEALSESVDSTGIITTMTTRYPDLPGRDTLEFGARVFMREQEWHVANPYPPIGKLATVDFGGVAFELDFTDNRTMSFKDTSGAFDGISETVEYTAVEVSGNVFMVYWHEPKSGSNVVHVQDWNTSTAWTNIAAKDGSFTNLKGTIKLRHLK